jgi:hypothetical protein
VGERHGFNVVVGGDVGCGGRHGVVLSVSFRFARSELPHKAAESRQDSWAKWGRSKGE